MVSEEKNYFTVSGQSNGRYDEKGSKFFSFLFRVFSLEDVKSHLSSLKKDHPKANHFPYAFILEDGEIGFSDDGEPNGSAGKPLLNHLKGNSLRGVLVIVVRYFGGKKLGVGGLVSAFSSAVEDSLKNTKLISYVRTSRFSISFPYSFQKKVSLLLQREGVVFESENFFESSIECTFRLPFERVSSLKNQLKLLGSIKFQEFD